MVQSDWLVILNPHAGSRRGAHDKGKIMKLLKKHKINFHMVTTDYPRHAISLAGEMVTAGYRNIIIAGGDGTLNEVVNGVFQQSACPPEEVTVGMIPVGTGNDWIRTFGIPDDYKKAIETILEGKTIRQDVGEITIRRPTETVTRYFMNMAGFGFDALTAARANRLKDKGKSGIRVYVQSLVSSYLSHRSRRLRYFIDGEAFETVLFSASVGIGKFNGGGMMQAPGAIPDNGEFQATVIRRIGLLGILRNFTGLYNGSFIRDKHVTTHTARQIIFDSDRPIPGESDGETLKRGHYTLQILPGKINVIYGNDRYFSHPTPVDEPSVK
ncbi:diacylglycerol kinase [Prolixibacter bellariivorans]|uniref:Diacylglycerol kinase n=1 Tax=Prolixibacter bellariivorans TaxID=314319 RepID=A0A5M4B4E8_9BACT|nr:diacylglycerol kinase family protein [Prolixibacter bellariivorans]GET34728.1 diacylglycerol kinase [Prolixibacter bellariivorans]